MRLALDALHQPEQVPVDDRVLLDKGWLDQSHVALLGEYVLQLLAQHQRIQIRHRQVAAAAAAAGAIGRCLIRVRLRLLPLDLHAEEGHGELVAGMAGGVQVGVLRRPAAHDLLVVDEHRAVVALRAGRQLDHHIAVPVGQVLGEGKGKCEV